MFSLPFELQDLIYDFDGRYKIDNDKCIELIRQRGLTPIGIRGSDKWNNVYRQIDEFDMKTFHRRLPEYYAELNRRVAMYRSRIEPSGHIRGMTTHLKRLPKKYCFNDALGSYTLGKVFETVMINGKAYKSLDKAQGIALDRYGRHGTTPTIVKCIDILDPEFKKSIKGRKVKAFRELGVSDNGIPASIYKKVFGSLHYSFGFDERWFTHRKCEPPASLSAVTDMLQGSKGVFTLDGKDYMICIKTGTGIVFQGKEAVGYVTKKMSMRFTVK
jgi:hypothetical protein